MVVENFQLYGLQITGKCMCQSFPLVFIITPSPGQREVPHFPQAVHFSKIYFPQSEGDIMSYWRIFLKFYNITKLSAKPNVKRMW